MLRYWVWLSELEKLTLPEKHRLLDRFANPRDAFLSAREEDLSFLSDAARQELTRPSLDHAERVLELCQQKRIGLLTQQDASYPARLRNIDISERGDRPPLVLYTKGRQSVLDSATAFAMVGSRSATAYGYKIAAEIAYELSKAGMVVVSGMALGIDGYAHRGALRAGAPTVAVLGSGVDVVYPGEHKSLYEDICTAGVVVSEYPPGARPIGSHFPARNRIISGLSLGVLVIEAPLRSGALITAERALGQYRDIFAVPGNINVPENAGCHLLIQEGAKLVTCAEDILCEYREQYKIAPLDQARAAPQNLVPPPRKTVPAEETPPPRAVTSEALEAAMGGQSEEARAILRLLRADILHVDDIIRRAGLPTGEALAALTMLELEDWVTQHPGKRFELTKQF